MINVQFTDASAQVIQAYLASPQDPDLWPNQGTVEASDPRWKVFYDAQPELSRQYLPSPE
jgi:hypothetical protein